MLLPIGIVTLAFNIQPVKASGTIYIRADGSIEPSTAPIFSADNVTYTFADNINDEIVIERDNVVIDGKGYNLSTGYVEWTGIYLSDRKNVTIHNVRIMYSGGIRLKNCSGITILGNNITHSGTGVWLAWSLDNIIRDNNISHMEYHGIFLDQSHGNLIDNNKITDIDQDGIELSGSYNNTLLNNVVSQIQCEGIRIGGCDNIISSNTIADCVWEGIVLASNNFVHSNVVTNTYCGIQIHNYTGNIVYGNIIACNDIGIGLGGIGYYYNFSASGNTIYHNNFLGNTKHLEDLGKSVNTWDDDYPSGGNYWSDYNGSDGDHNGIGDTPYVIDENNQDNYPLMGPITDFLVSLDEKIYHVTTICNSTVSDFHYTPQIISFNAAGEDGTLGFCRIVVPKVLLGGGPYYVLVDGIEIPYSVLPCSNATHIYLCFTYSHSIHQIVIKGKAVDTTPPTISVLYPENKTYTITSIPLTFTVDEPTSWIGYNLDNHANVTVAGNTTLIGLSEGAHSIIVYANDTVGNMGSSETVYFAVALPCGPTADFTVTPETTNIGESVLFDASASQPGSNGTDTMPITEYRWDFGDGNETTTSSPVVYHSFDGSGNYYVTLTVYAFGATPETDSITHKVTVVSVPVGGYSLSLNVCTTAKPLASSIALMAILAAAFLMVKHRKKQRLETRN